MAARATLLTIERLTKMQRASLRLDEGPGIKTAAQAAKFIRTVGFALRYGATEGLPLASMYHAAWKRTPERERETEGQRRAIELTNALLAKRQAIEVSIIADRLVLADPKLIPALYVLRRRGRRVEDLGGLSIEAARAYALISQRKTATAGEVRAHLGIQSKGPPDPATLALGELQNHLLVDRGKSDVPAEGLPYLSKEGYPYRVFHRVHKDLLKKAAKLDPPAAALAVVGAYLKAAVFVTPRKLASLFKLCLDENEIRWAIGELVNKKKARLQGVGHDEIVVKYPLSK